MVPKWGEITAREIIPAIQGEMISGHPDSIFTGLATDSREVTPGQLFWALKGENHDGHDFTGNALDKGVSGIVIQKGYRPENSPGRFPVVIVVKDTLKALGDLAGWWRRQHSIPLAAITGSAGKTTTKEMAASILGLGNGVLKNKGNLNNLIGLPLTLLQLKEGHRRAVLEMGMNRPGEIGRLTEIADPDVGVITNVGRAHLEGLGSIEGVAKAKVEMLEKMSSTGHMILNGDDELLMKAAAPFRKRVVTFGLGSANDIRAARIQSLGRAGISFELNYHEHSTSVKLPVPGIQNVFNSLAASAIAICLGESPDCIVRGLSRFEPVKGRFNIITLPGGAILVDDTYNANPSSLRAAVESLKALAMDRGKLIVGLGDMLELGDETVPAHLEAGGMVTELGASYFVAMGEHARRMIEGAVSKGFPQEKALVAATYWEMAERIKEVMEKGDLIFLKGSRKMCLEKVVEALGGNHSKEV